MLRPADEAPATDWRAYAEQLESWISVLVHDDRNLPPQVARLYLLLRSTPGRVVPYGQLVQALHASSDPHAPSHNDIQLVQQLMSRLRKLRPELRIRNRRTRGYCLKE